MAEIDEFIEEGTRAGLWASTMQGVVEAGVEFAHRDSAAFVGHLSRRTREDQEALEVLSLAAGATIALGAGRRKLEEAPDAVRTCFQRDHDRVLHSAAFRRLAGKTQVFVFPSDHQRTRLTHALEVAQVAKSIARAARLNEDLAAVAATSHDVGHGPGGHPSEEAFTPFIEGGFDHATWGADVVLAPLNLCAETLDAVRNHSWSRPAPMTPEGEVVSWADRIAYVCHDWEDAVATGIVSAHDLPKLVAERCGTSRSRQLATFIAAVVHAIDTSGRVGMNAEIAEALSAFRQRNYELVYLRPESVTQGRLVREVLEALVEHFARHPGDIGATPALEDAAATPAAYRAAVRYVAGMTDRFALEAAVRLLDWPVDRLPRALPACAEAQSLAY